MTDETTEHDPDEPDEILEALNAEDVIEHPGEPPRQVESPASDADVQAPG